MRKRPPTYRRRRKARHALRRMRASERRDAQTMLELTPGYVDMLERDSELERALELAMEWDSEVFHETPR